MSALQTLHDLLTRGFSLHTDGKALAVRPKELLRDSDRSAIRSHKFELIKSLSESFGDSEQTTVSEEVITKWHARSARFWLGITEVEGIEYRTLEYEFDSTISPKWLNELERDKGFIQTALVAQEVRQLSTRYWAERKAKQAKTDTDTKPTQEWRPNFVHA